MSDWPCEDRHVIWLCIVLRLKEGDRSPRKGRRSTDIYCPGHNSRMAEMAAGVPHRDRPSLSFWKSELHLELESLNLPLILIISWHFWTIILPGIWRCRSWARHDELNLVVNWRDMRVHLSTSNAIFRMELSSLITARLAVVVLGPGVRIKDWCRTSLGQQGDTA